jgi:hypothetical protein
LTFLVTLEKKKGLKKEMEVLTTSLKVVAGIAVVGAILETFVPGLISKQVQGNLSALTIGFLGIAFSCLFLMIFLKLRIREGFEDPSYITRWKTMVDTNKVKEVCDLYTEMYEKILSVEKGAPPDNVKTDAQAREATDAKFKGVMTYTAINCKEVEEIQSKVNSADGFYLAIQKAPDIFFAQVYDTALGCRSLLIQNLLEKQQADQRRKEAFQDLCSDTAAEERREFKNRKPLSEEAQKCYLVEEIPPEKKANAIFLKLDRMDTALSNLKKMKNTEESVSKILDDCAYYKKELEKEAKEAQETSNKYNFK